MYKKVEKKKSHKKMPSQWADRIEECGIIGARKQDKAKEMNESLARFFFFECKYDTAA